MFFVGGSTITDGRSIAALDKQYVWHPFTAMADWLGGEPNVITDGEGAYLINSGGRRYLDGVSSLWCNVHGHRHPTIDAAVREQVGKIAHSTWLGLTGEPGVLLAEQLITRAPRGEGARLARVFYSDSGATACEIAAKIAFHYWPLRGQPGRTKFLTFSLGYHGDTIGMVSLGGIDLFHAIYRPLLFETIHAPAAYCYRCALEDCPRKTAPNDKCMPPFSRTTEGRRAVDYPCLRAVEQLLTENAGQVAAVFVEPLIQGAAGVITSPPGYLAELRRITRRHDVLLVADEVAVGFGRTGTMFACEQEGVVPDLMCLAKVITGGYLPLAATLVSEQVFEPFNQPGVTFFHGHTYTGNALAAAAGLASLRVFDEERVLENLPPKIERFNHRLGRLWRFPNVGDVRSRGLFAGVELVEDRATKRLLEHDERRGRAICDAAWKRGLFIRPLGDVLVFIPPLCVTVEQIDFMFDVVEEAIEEVRA
ncbi:MAG: adenosylmethionine--8-amino-7-oxononanoate transaminase [Phycisphaerae bacterium]|nr:adenosylmethionine--8-amino-7-oxononanoate transaminase [Phycisphaerae bacterium]